MSRIGKSPIEVPSDVKVSVSDKVVSVSGKLGPLEYKLSDFVNVDYSNDNSQLLVTPVDGTKKSNAMWGTTTNLIKNMITGVSVGFTKTLVINGVGYKSSLSKKTLVLSLGYSHDIIFAIPDGIEIICEKPTLIHIKGRNKRQVGQIAGEIIKYRPVEPYKGKGIYIFGSYIRRKEGKKK